MAEKGWREIPTIGAIIPEAGNSISYETGAWRSLRPIFDREKCIQCLLCWVYCPDCSILTENGEVTDIDLRYCKGCSICSQECPVGAITMIEEIAAEVG